MINPNCPRNGFLFGDKDGPWKTQRQTDIFTRETSTRLGFRLTSQEYRHFSAALDRKFIRKKDTDDEDFDPDEDDGHDLMAAHSSRIANNVYGRNGGLLHKLSAQSIDFFRDISDKWQKWLELISRLPRRAIMGTDEKSNPVPISIQISCAMVRIFGT